MSHGMCVYRLSELMKFIFHCFYKNAPAYVPALVKCLKGSDGEITVDCSKVKNTWPFKSTDITKEYVVLITFVCRKMAVVIVKGRRIRMDCLNKFRSALMKNLTCTKYLDKDVIDSDVWVDCDENLYDAIEKFNRITLFKYVTMSALLESIIEDEQERQELMGCMRRTNSYVNPESERFILRYADLMKTVVSTLM